MVTEPQSHQDLKDLLLTTWSPKPLEVFFFFKVNGRPLISDLLYFLNAHDDKNFKLKTSVDLECLTFVLNFCNRTVLAFLACLPSSIL